MLAVLSGEEGRLAASGSTGIRSAVERTTNVYTVAMATTPELDCRILLIAHIGMICVAQSYSWPRFWPHGIGREEHFFSGRSSLQVPLSVAWRDWSMRPTYGFRSIAGAPQLAQPSGSQPGREVPDDHCHPLHRARHDPARLQRNSWITRPRAAAGCRSAGTTAVQRERYRQAPGQVDQGSLTGGIADAAATRQQPADRRDVHDAAAALSAHNRGGRPRRAGTARGRWFRRAGPRSAA